MRLPTLSEVASYSAVERLKAMITLATLLPMLPDNDP